MDRAKVLLKAIGLMLIVYVCWVYGLSFFQPVRVIIQDGFKGAIKIEYRPTIWGSLGGQSRSFEVDESGNCVTSTKNPFARFCEIRAFVRKENELREVEVNYELKPSSDDAKFYVVELRDENDCSWFVFGSWKDLNSTLHKVKGRSMDEDGNMVLRPQ